MNSVEFICYFNMFMVFGLCWPKRIFFAQSAGYLLAGQNACLLVDEECVRSNVETICILICLLCLVCPHYLWLFGKHAFYCFANIHIACKDKTQTMCRTQHRIRNKTQECIAGPTSYYRTRYVGDTYLLLPRKSCYPHDMGS